MVCQWYDATESSRTHFFALWSVRGNIGERAAVILQVGANFSKPTFGSSVRQVASPSLAHSPQTPQSAPADRSMCRNQEGLEANAHAKEPGRDLVTARNGAASRSRGARSSSSRIPTSGTRYQEKIKEGIGSGAIGPQEARGFL